MWLARAPTAPGHHRPFVRRRALSLLTRLVARYLACVTDWLIIADDLTGAADCASAFAGRGLDAVVSWGSIDCEAPVLSVDANSRHLPAVGAAARQVAALTAHWRPGMRLYKKIDSPLRGQPAAELAALLSAWSVRSRQPAPLAIVAPAFPATGRVTLEGRIRLHELP